MNTCKTCKWWRKWTGEYITGECHAVKELITTEKDRFNVFFEDLPIGSAPLETGQDFGCIHWSLIAERSHEQPRRQDAEDENDVRRGQRCTAYANTYRCVIMTGLRVHCRKQMAAFYIRPQQATDRCRLQPFALCPGPVCPRELAEGPWQGMPEG